MQCLGFCTADSKDKEDRKSAVTLPNMRLLSSPVNGDFKLCSSVRPLLSRFRPFSEESEQRNTRSLHKLNPAPVFHNIIAYWEMIPTHQPEAWGGIITL